MQPKRNSGDVAEGRACASAANGMSDLWLRDCTASGSAASVREQLSAWADKGVLPIAVMSSTSGGQAKAIAELFDAYR
jgi:hypothetical protein